jgi:hypothetical protein
MSKGTDAGLYGGGMGGIGKTNRSPDLSRSGSLTDEVHPFLDSEMVYMCIYICIYIYMYLYINRYVYVYIYIHIYIYIYIYIYI